MSDGVEPTTADASGPREAAFTPDFKRDEEFWRRSDPKVAARLRRLVKETLREPFTGIGKPEALKENWQWFWSRRLTREHRLINRVEPKEVVFVSARFHY